MLLKAITHTNKYKKRRGKEGKKDNITAAIYYF
jgi:hypothetical protein